MVRGRETMEENIWNDDIEDVEPVIDAESQFLGALETLDVNRIVACWSESEQATLVFPGVDMARGPAAIRMAWVEVADHTSKLRPVVKPVSYIRMGDMGWTFLSGTLMSTHGDETLSVEVYITNVYLRESEGWKLLHMHVAPSPHQPSYLEQRLN